MAIAQVLVITILQSLNLSHILSSFIKILIQYFFFSQISWQVSNLFGETQ